VDNSKKTYSKQENETSKELIEKLSSKTLVKNFLPAPIWGIIIFLMGGVTAYAFMFLTGYAFSWAIEPIRETRWYLLPPMLGMGILFVILFKKVVRQKIQVLELMLLFAGIVLLMFFLELIDYDHKGGGIFHRADGGFLINFADALLPLAVITFYLHLELTSRDYPNVFNSVIIIGSAAPLSFLVSIKPFTKSFIRVIEVNDLIHAYQIAFSIGTLLMGIYGIYMFYQVFKEADTFTAELASALNEIGAFIILLSFVISPLGDYFYMWNFKINIYNTWLFTFGIMIILLVYIIIPTYAYAFPFNVYEIFVVDSGGSTYYHKTIEIPQGVQKLPDATLKSPAIIAIASLVSELSGARGKLRSIMMTDRVILVNVIENVVGIMLADRTSFFLKRGFEQFINEFVENYREEIEMYSGNITVFKNADKLLRRIFPFVK